MGNTTSRSSMYRPFRKLLIISVPAILLAIILIQQSRIRTLAQQSRPSPSPTSERSLTTSSIAEDQKAHIPRKSQSRDDLTAHARQQHLQSVEAQLAEISAPLTADMASTMFNAEIKNGQSLVTGGYQTADGKNQFTILKPRVVRDSKGREQIEIDSKLIAMTPDDTRRTGLDTLATNAKNTLQHGESWEESDVSQTMDIIQNSSDSNNLGQPKVIVEPGRNFTIEMTSDDRGTYTLSGTATPSPDGSGVALKARIEQKQTQPQR